MGGAGTIPVPTPTPWPTPEPRSAERIKLAIESYVELTAPIVKAAGLWVIGVDQAWPGAEPGRQADLLLVESARIATLCTATSGVAPDYVMSDVHSRWTGALEARQRWASEAANGLACCGTAGTPELNGLREDAARRIASAAAALESEVGRYGVRFAADDSYPITNERLRITASVPADWVVARNDTQMALVAPRSLQLSTIEGLGVDGSNLGTAVRIRRLRKQADWTLDGAIEQARAALSNLGVERARRDLELVTGPAAELLLATEVGEWTTRLIIAGAGDYAYFVEMGCPGDLQGPCDAEFDDVLEGLVLDSP